MTATRSLVIADEPNLCDPVAATLRPGGYRVRTALSGDEALREAGDESPREAGDESLREAGDESPREAGEFPPDLVVPDLVLPDLQA